MYSAQADRAGRYWENLASRPSLCLPMWSVFMHLSDFSCRDRIPDRTIVKEKEFIWFTASEILFQYGGELTPWQPASREIPNACTS